MLMSVAGRVLVALGIGLVTYAAIDTGITAFKTSAMGYMAAAPGTIVNILYMTKVDQAITIIFSAYLGTVAMRGISGAITKFAFKAPA
jgi:hypothetical protein